MIDNDETEKSPAEKLDELERAFVFLCAAAEMYQRWRREEEPDHGPICESDDLLDAATHGALTAADGLLSHFTDLRKVLPPCQEGGALQPQQA